MKQPSACYIEEEITFPIYTSPNFYRSACDSGHSGVPMTSIYGKFCTDHIIYYTVYYIRPVSNIILINVLSFLFRVIELEFYKHNSPLYERYVHKYIELDFLYKNKLVFTFILSLKIVFSKMSEVLWLITKVYFILFLFKGKVRFFFYRTIF